MTARRTGIAPVAAPPAGPQEWAVSPFNTEGIAAGGAFDTPPRISDCTLRDGEQQAGLVFSRQSKVAIAAMLDEIGVHDIEVGTPAVSEDDRAAIEEIAASGLRATISALARATEADIDLVAGTGADAVRISFPISSRQRAAKLHVDDSEYVRDSLRISHYAKSLGLQVVLALRHHLGDLPLLERLLRAFRQEGCVDRVRLVDTVGAASPEGVRFLIGFMREALGDIPIEVHCHNDFGLGTANTIAAALAGADYLSVTVNGLGERAGNTPLEEVVVALKVLYGIDTGVATGRLKPVSDEVGGYRALACSHKAVVGASCFRHETGTVVAGLMRDPFTAEPTHRVVGQANG